MECYNNQQEGVKVIRFHVLNFQTFNKSFINEPPKYVKVLKQIEFGNEFWMAFALQMIFLDNEFRI